MSCVCVMYLCVMQLLFVWDGLARQAGAAGVIGVSMCVCIYIYIYIYICT